MSVPGHLSRGHFLLQSSVTKTKSQSASLFTGSVRILLRNLLTTTSRSIWILSSLVAFVLWSVFGKVKISLHDTNPTELVSLMASLLILPITRAKSGGPHFPSTLFYQLSPKRFWLEEILLFACYSFCTSFFAVFRIINAQFSATTFTFISAFLNNASASRPVFQPWLLFCCVTSVYLSCLMPCQLSSCSSLFWYIYCC